jgi:medium-chain acyl-[acyl-carrier-protein] hydrolase
VTRWLYRPGGSREARIRLFCFPYAGGGVGIFRSWSGSLSPDVEIVGIRMPGRESRLAEPPYTRWQPLVDDLSIELWPLFDRPFVLFGHSFGAMLAYEIASAICQRGRLPEALIVSACRPPHERARSRAPYDAPSEAFWDWVMRLDGTPLDVLRDPDLRAALEPAMRADLQLAETWHATKFRFDRPLVAFAGARDRVVPPEQIAGWRGYTECAFRYCEFPGGHFFLHAAQPEVVARVSEICRAA